VPPREGPDRKEVMSLTKEGRRREEVVYNYYIYILLPPSSRSWRGFGFIAASGRKAYWR
jgi:hypothetical protein